MVRHQGGQGKGLLAKGLAVSQAANESISGINDKTGAFSLAAKLIWLFALTFYNMLHCPVYFTMLPLCRSGQHMTEHLIACFLFLYALMHLDPDRIDR